MQITMYDNTENTTTRFVGFVGDERWDLAITQTNNFYGKSLVVCLQTNRVGILGKDDLEEDKRHLLLDMFGLKTEEQVEELADYLQGHL